MQQTCEVYIDKFAAKRLTLSARPRSFGEPASPRHIAHTRDDLPLPDI